MKKIILQRFIHDKVTFGKLNLTWLKEFPDIYTIELPWKDNQENISCIPQGLYNCVPHNGKEFQDTWQVLNVPGRTVILFHVGNYASAGVLPYPPGKAFKSNTKGCILPGFGINEDIPMVERSGLAMEFLRNAIGLQNNFSLEVKD